MQRTALFLFVVFMFVARPAGAEPMIEIRPTGVSGNIHHWDILVGPDVATFVPNTSLAVEIDLDFPASLGEIISATLNDDLWNVAPVDNPGNNPFTGTTATGVVVDTAADTVFVAAGSELFATSDPVRLLTIEASVDGFGELVVAYDGRTLLPGGAQEYTSSRVTQNGVTFDGLNGFWGLAIDGWLGDFDGSGAVEGADLSLLLGNWGAAVPPAPEGWDGHQPTAPAVDGDDLSALLSNWGVGASSAGAAVPEPTSIVFAAGGLMSLALVRRRLD